MMGKYGDGDDDIDGHGADRNGVDGEFWVMTDRGGWW